MLEYRGMLTDSAYMKEAIDEARTAAAEGEVPVGAVVVRNGEIIARAHNMVESSRSSSAHAEMLAISEAESKVGKWLLGCSMYVTLEPCTMCAGAIVLARIANLYIGASDPKAGACGSVSNVVNNGRLNHKVNLVSGIEAGECSEILKEFFRERRINR